MIIHIKRGIKGKPAKVAINSPKLIKIMKEKDKLPNEEEQQFMLVTMQDILKTKLCSKKAQPPNGVK